MNSFVWGINLGIVKIGWKEKYLSNDFKIQIKRLCIDY
jgi:hypothetical protein